MAEKARSTLDLVPIVSVLPEPPNAQDAGAIAIKRDGSAIMILRVRPVDFDMRSPDEQEGILARWAEMLDSLEEDCPIQIVCHNKKLDAEAYLRQYEGRLQKRDLPDLHRRLITALTRHFQYQITENTMVQKEYYLVVPYGVRSGAILDRTSDNMPFGIFFRRMQENSNNKRVDEPDMQMLQVVRFELESRVGQIQYFLDSMDCESDRLTENQIRRLFVELFHPSLAERQKPITPQRGRSFAGRADVEAIQRRRKQLAQERENEIMGGGDQGQLPPTRRSLPPSNSPQNPNYPQNSNPNYPQNPNPNYPQNPNPNDNQFPPPNLG